MEEVETKLEYLNIEDINVLLRSDVDNPIFLLVCGKECSLSLDYYNEFQDFKNTIKNAKFYHTYFNDIREIDNISNIAVTPACYVFYRKKYYLEYLISQEIINDIIKYLDKKYNN